jgi:hypothetical protein
MYVVLDAASEKCRNHRLGRGASLSSLRPLAAGLSQDGIIKKSVHDKLIINRSKERSACMFENTQENSIRLVLGMIASR